MRTLLLTSAIFFVSNCAHHGMLKKLDLDHDQKISHEEFISGHEKMFSEMDLNKDGFVTVDEIKKAHH